MNELHTVFWDFDGTIADTEMQGHMVAFNKAFKHNKVNWIWDESLYSNLLEIAGGKKRIKYYSEQIKSPISSEYILRIHNSKQIFYKQLVSNDFIKPRIGVLRLVKELSLNNIDQWIVTSASLSSVNSVLRFIYRDKNIPFKGIISGDDVQKSKPSSEAYLLALKKASVNNKNTLAIEDSLVGVKAAKGANIKCIMTLSPWINSITTEMKLADLIVDNLGDNNSNCNTLYGHNVDNMVNYKCIEKLFRNNYANL